jgi:hypothetical protein
MNRTKDRLKKKLEEKKNSSSITPCSSIDETTIQDKPVFRFIFNQNIGFKEKAATNDYFFISEKHRLKYIRDMVKKQSDACKVMTPDQLSTRKREIVIALHDKWFDSFFESCSVIEYSDKPQFTDARFFKWYNHTIIVIEKSVDKPQQVTDYLCLNFIRWHQLYTGIEDDGLDIIISKDSLRVFFCSMIGYDFYNAILEDEFMMSLTPDFSEQDILIVSKSLGNIYLPRIEFMQYAFREFSQCIAYWSQLPK